MKTTLMIF